MVGRMSLPAAGRPRLAPVGAPATGLGLAGALLLSAYLALAGLVAGAAPASAHDAVISVAPASGSTVETAPATVELVLGEPAIAIGTAILVLGPGGAIVSAGAPALVGATVSQGLVETRPAGTYTVEWRVTSADGHPISGRFTFTAAAPVAPAPVGPPTSEPATTAIPDAATGSATPVAQIGAPGGSGAGVLPWVVGAGALAAAFVAGALWWVRR